MPNQKLAKKKANAKARAQKSALKKKKPSMYLSTQKRLPAAISSNVVSRGGRKVTRIAHSEYLDAVCNPQNSYCYYLQPSSFETFTWLPAIASRYEVYRVVAFRLRYIPSCGSSTDGAIHICVDFDCLDQDPTTANTFSQYSVYGRCSVWEPLTVVLPPSECNRIPWHYTAHSGYPTVYDRKTYDFGKVHVLGVGTHSPAITAGELYMDYVLEFSQPTVEDVSVFEINIGKEYTLANELKLTSVATPTVTSCYGTLPIQALGTISGLTVTDRDAHTQVGEMHVYKALRDFHGELTTSFSSPYSTDTGIAYWPLELVKSNTQAGPFTAATTMDNITKQNRYMDRVMHYLYSGKNLGGTTGGMLEILVKAGEYFGLPWIRNTPYLQNANGGNDIIYHVRSLMGSLADYTLPTHSSSSIEEISSNVKKDEEPQIASSQKTLEQQCLTCSCKKH